MIYYTDYAKTEEFETVRKRKQGGWVDYCNIPCAFDTETTSFYTIGGKCAYCYIWQMCINGVTVYGRTLEEFVEFSKTLQHLYNLSEDRRLIVYVHNLEFDFQFIRKYFKWVDIFAREQRKPLYACNTYGLEFRCSYMLTLLPLAKLTENLQNPSVKKMVGDMDYNLPRHSETPLTEKEMKYCENDVLLLCEYIREEIAHNDNKITNIPLTKTGYVRNKCRKALNVDKNFWKEYRKKLDKSQPDPDLFSLLNKAYQGGYTHSNSIYVDIVLDNVKSIDFASSYPTQMVCKKFPWKFRQLQINDIDTFELIVEKNACVFEVGFYNLRAKRTTTILSSSKCDILENAVLDNGRVYSCDYCTTYITSLDWVSINDFYDFDDFEIGDFWAAKYEPLPKPLIDVILQCYTDKTTLKGIKGKEQEYLVSKGIINGVYGMCVTNPVCDMIDYDNNCNDWSSTPPDIIDCLNDLVSSRSTFLLYQWGVWVSAYARHELLKFVNEIESKIGNFVVYCDTDSIKYINNPEIDILVKEYNEKQKKVFEKIAKEYSYTIPKTSKGEKAYLGVFDYDGEYIKFKTLGAKRYIDTILNNQKSEELHITIAGLSKLHGGNYIASQTKPFDFFSDGMFVPPENTGKMTRTYIDDEVTTQLTDYYGNSCTVYCPSGVHLEPCSFEMTLNNKFVDLFHAIQSVGTTGKRIDGTTPPELSVGIQSAFDNLRNDIMYKN